MISPPPPPPPDHAWGPWRTLPGVSFRSQGHASTLAHALTCDGRQARVLKRPSGTYGVQVRRSDDPARVESHVPHLQSQRLAQGA